MPTLAEILAGVEPQSFSDVPNWRQREVAGQLAPGRQAPLAPIDPKYEQFPMSANVDDRRQTPAPWLDMLSKEWLGWNLPKAIEHVKEHGLTSPENMAKARFDNLVPLVSDNPLARDAGYNDIPVYPSRLNLPWWQR